MDSACPVILRIEGDRRFRVYDEAPGFRPPAVRQRRFCCVYQEAPASRVLR